MIHGDGAATAERDPCDPASTSCGSTDKPHSQRKLNVVNHRTHAQMSADTLLELLTNAGNAGLMNRTHLINRMGCVAEDWALGQGVRKENIQGIFD